MRDVMFIGQLGGYVEGAFEDCCLPRANRSI